MSAGDRIIIDPKNQFKGVLGDVSGTFKTSKANKDIEKYIKQAAKNGKVKIPVDMEPDSSKVDTAKKEASKPVETPVKLILDDSDLKKLNNLPTAKMKLEFLIDQKAVDKEVGKTISKSFQTVYRKIDNSTRLKTEKPSLDRFMTQIPDLSKQAYSKMVTELNKKGIPEAKIPEYETAYRLRNYIRTAKDSMTDKQGRFSVPTGTLQAPDIGLSSKEYGTAVYDQLQAAKTIVRAAEFFEQVNADLQITTRGVDLSSNKFKELTGIGMKKNDSNYKENNYKNYIADQITKRAGLYDIVDQIVSGTFKNTDVNYKSITDKINDSLQISLGEESKGLTKQDLNYIDTNTKKTVSQIVKTILKDAVFGKDALSKNGKKDLKAVAEEINDTVSVGKKSKFIGLMATYFAKGGTGLENEDTYKYLFDYLTDSRNSLDTKGAHKRQIIEDAVKQMIESGEYDPASEKQAAITEKTTTKETTKTKKTATKKTVTKKETTTSTVSSQGEDNTDSSTPTSSTPSTTSDTSQPVKKTTSTSKNTSKNTSKTKKTKQLTEEQLGRLEGDLETAYENYQDAKSDYTLGRTTPTQYLVKYSAYRQAYVDALKNGLPSSSFEMIVGKRPTSLSNAEAMLDNAMQTMAQVRDLRKPVKDLGYTRENNPEMFEMMDEMVKTIVSINNDRYNNRKSQNGDTDKIVQDVQKVQDLATKVEAMIQADGHKDFTLKGIPTTDKAPKKETPVSSDQKKDTKKEKTPAKKQVAEKEKASEKEDKTPVKEETPVQKETPVKEEVPVKKETLKKTSDSKKPTVKKEVTTKEEKTVVTEKIPDEASDSKEIPVKEKAPVRKTTAKKTKKTTKTKQVEETPADDVIAENDKIIQSEKEVIDVQDEKEKKLDDTVKKTVSRKKRESKSVKTSNDEVIKSEEKLDEASEKIISDVFRIGNGGNNSDLTEYPTTPDALKGMKQISQKEFGDAQKFIKIYQDTNKTLYTLTQTYSRQLDENGMLKAEGYRNAISSYDNYEKIESDAIKLRKRINSNYAKLDTERYKPTEKQNPNLKKKLQNDIKSDLQDLSELHHIARLNSSDSMNDYTYGDFTKALRVGGAESSRALSATLRTNRDNFNGQKDIVNTNLEKQISEVESLGQAGAIAASKLTTVQQSLSSITTPAGLEDTKKQIEDINKQFDSNKARENALNYVHGLEKGLNGKQTVSIGEKDSSWYENSVKNGQWVGPLAKLNSSFEVTSNNLDKYIADAQKLGEVGSKYAESFSVLREKLNTTYTKPELEDIQNQAKIIQTALEASKSLESQYDKNEQFVSNKINTTSQLDGYISEAKQLGTVGEEAVKSYEKLRTAIQSCYTESGLKQIQNQIKETKTALHTSKQQAEEMAKNSEASKIQSQYDQIMADMSNLEKKNKELRSALKNDKNSDYIKNITAERDGYKQAVESADEYINKHKEVLGSQSVKKYNTAKSRVNQIETDIENDIAAQVKKIDTQALTDRYDAAINKAKEIKSLNAEILNYKKKQTQYAEDSDTYNNIGARINEATQASKKATTEFEKMTEDKFVSTNADALKAAGRNVETYNKAVREMQQSQSDISGFDDKISQATNTQNFSQRYTDAIEKVKELKSAIQDLYTFQSQGAKGQFSSDEIVKGVTDRVGKITKLQEEVNKFKNESYSINKENKDSILNTTLFKNYEQQDSDLKDSIDSYNNDIGKLMNQAYSRQRKLTNQLYKMVGSKNYSEQEYIEKWDQMNSAFAVSESLKAQIRKINPGNIKEVEDAFSTIKISADIDRNNILGGLQESLTSQINDFDASLKHMQNTMNLPEGILSLREKLQSAFTLEDGADNLSNFKNKMQDFYQTFDSLKGNSFIQFANEFGTAFDKLTKAENSSNKVSAYTDKLNGFVTSYNEIISNFNNGKIDTNQAQYEISKLSEEMQNFQKIAKGYDKVNSKGTYIEGTSGRVHDSKDVQTVLTEYAKSIGLTSQLSSNINETTGQVKMQFADISGNVVTLTGNLEEAGNAMRVFVNTASKSATGMTSFGNTIKGMVSGNFKGAIADIANYVSYFQVTMKAIQQAKEGFNTFLNYEKDLTNISYTMDMSPAQLQNLGKSAIEMAKDLSMSLDNTMDIYKIYANMNTTASEIQETAKPTAILSNLSGVDASTAADQVQGILQQFHMLEDGSTTAADASMHIVDVLDKVSGSVGIDYAKGIKIISDAVQASGQVAYDAGMSYEQLAAITAKVSERTREDGSSIGNALKTNKLSLCIEICAM